MTELIEKMLAISMLLIGLSHMIHARRWSAFFTDFIKRPEAALVIAMLTLPWAILLAVGHNTWTRDLSVITTIMGWGMLIKCTRYLLFPGSTETISRWGLTTPRNYAIIGAVMSVLGVVMTLHAFRTA